MKTLEALLRQVAAALGIAVGTGTIPTTAPTAVKAVVAGIGGAGMLRKLRHRK